MKGRQLGTYGVAFLVLVFGILFVLWRGGKQQMERREIHLASIDTVPESRWQALAGKKIFFGHQSVGRNLIDGIGEVMEDHPEVQLNIIESPDWTSVDGPAFVHCAVGSNTRPDLKLDNFDEIVSVRDDVSVDIAFLKFCYVDFGRDTKVPELFHRYLSTLSNLGDRFPDTIFVHLTVPLQSGPRGIVGAAKEYLKAILRRPGLAEKNRVRQEYNELLRSTYSGKEPIFDIAQYEAIGPEGLVSYRVSESEKVEMMDARFTNDGGHLNKRGRRHVAEQLLVTLAHVAGD